MLEWTLVTVAPNTERKVKAALELCEFRHHMFRHRETIVRHGRRLVVLRFTFGRYAFVPLTDWRTIAERINQVVGPVRFGDDLAVVPPGVVEELAASCIAPDVLPAILKPALFTPGAPVQIATSGPLEGQLATYIRPTAFGRCQVELAAFGRVELDEASLRPAPTIGAKRKRYRKHRCRRRR